MALGVSSAHAWLTLGALSLAVAACLWPLITEGSEAPPAKQQSEANHTHAEQQRCLRLGRCLSLDGFKAHIVKDGALTVVATIQERDGLKSAVSGEPTYVV